MAHVSTLTRLRTGDIRSIPIGVWPLLGLAIADVILRLQSRDRLLELTELASLFVVAAPFAFAAAVVYVAPADRRFVLGAIAMAVPELLIVLEMLLTPGFVNLLQDIEWTRLRVDVGWILSLGGLLLTGLALGGVKTRLGWAVVAVGAALFLIGVAWYASYVAANPLPEGLPIEYLPISLLAGSVVVGWAYLLGAALERGLRAITIGAVLILGLAALNVVSTVFPTAVPQSDFGALLTLTVVHLTAWVALIVGALTELHRGPRAEADEQLP